MCELFVVLKQVHKYLCIHIHTCVYVSVFSLWTCVYVCVQCMRFSVCVWGSVFTDMYVEVPRLIFPLSPPQAQKGTEMH